MIQSIPDSTRDLVSQESVKESTVGQEVVGQAAAPISNDVLDQLVKSTHGMASRYVCSAADEVVNLPITPKDQEDVNLTITKPSQCMVDNPDTQSNNAGEGQPLDLSVTVIASDSAESSQRIVQSVSVKDWSKEPEKSNVCGLPLDLSTKTSSSDGQDKEGPQAETEVEERTYICQTGFPG